MRNIARLFSIGKPAFLMLMALILLWWTSLGSLSGQSGLDFHFPSSIKDFTTIYLSIFLEAIPFVLLGVLISSTILVFVSEDQLQRFLPKNPLVAIVPAIVVAALFPVCECAIIPVVKRLIHKGMPAHIGIIFLIVTPIVNPIVYLSTHLAFRLNPSMVYGRMGLAIALAFVASLFVYFVFNKTSIMKKSEALWRKPVHKETRNSENKPSKMWAVLNHATSEFFDVGKFVIFGAFIAAFAQVSLNRALLGSFAGNIFLSSLLMMGLAFILSICSEADAFIGSSFSSLMPPGAILAFLVFGAIFDVKNTMMMFSVFRTRFVLLFLGLVTSLVLGGSLLFQYYMLYIR